MQKAVRNCDKRSGRQFYSMVTLSGSSACSWLFTHGAQIMVRLKQVQCRHRQVLELDGPHIPLMRNFVTRKREEMETEDDGAHAGGEQGTTQAESA